jgi:hypothetical protein
VLSFFVAQLEVQNVVLPLLLVGDAQICIYENHCLRLVTTVCVVATLPGLDLEAKLQPEMRN